MSDQKKEIPPASHEDAPLNGENVDALKETSALSTAVNEPEQAMPKGDGHGHNDEQVTSLAVSDDTAQLANKAASQGLTVLLLDLAMDMNAAQRQIYLLAQGLHNRDDMHVLVACPKHSALYVLLKSEGLSCWPLPSSQASSIRLWLSLLFLLYKRHVNIVHTQDALSAKIGWRLKRFFKDRFSLVHAQRVSCAVADALPMSKYMFYDGFICSCQLVADELIAAGMPEGKVSVVYSGTDPAQYPAKQVSPDDRFVFMAIGQLIPQKSYSTLFQSMLFLSEMDDLPVWEVRIVGNGALHHDLVKEVEDIGVASSVAMLGRQDHRIFLPDADALFSLSDDIELASATIREAWATGLPIICTNNPSNLELVQDKQNGLVVQEGNAGVLAGVMMRTMKERQHVIPYVEAGKASLEQYYLASQMVEKTLIFYKHIDAELRARPKK